MKNWKEAMEHIKEHRKEHKDSLDHAVAGWRYALTTQPNFKYHLFLSFCAIFLGIAYQISANEWLIIILMITWGLAMEMFNTLSESLTDLIKKEYDQDAKIVKDVAAGMMLVTAMGAAIIGGIIFIPRFISCLTG